MAKRFVFRLETLMRVRRQDMERQQRVLSDAVRGVWELDVYVGELNRELRETIQAGRGQQGQTRLDIALLRTHQLHGGWLRRQILTTRDELSRRELRVEEERRKLQDLNKRLKVIEKLRDRHWTRYREQVNREEQATNDEVGTQLFFSRRIAESEVNG